MLVPSKLAPAVTDFRLNCGGWNHECGGLAPAVNRLDESLPAPISSPKVGVSTPPVFRSEGVGTPPPPVVVISRDAEPEPYAHFILGAGAGAHSDVYGSASLVISHIKQWFRCRGRDGGYAFPQS